MKKIKPCERANLQIIVVWTVSTLTGQQKGSHPTPPIALSFPADYSDNFESYTVGQEANYFTDQTGVWEISLLSTRRGTRGRGKVVE
jgi:hypothetical protein